jgi:hypothetical protein
VPVCTDTQPELPDAVVPELSVSEPLTPLDTAFDDDTLTSPVDALVLAPDTIVTAPPDFDVAVAAPPEILTRPPTALDDKPLESSTSPPAVPLSLEPTSKLIDPPRPPIAAPDESDSQPVLPSVDVPLRS